MIDSFPITSVLVAPEQELVFFAGFTSFTAYGASGFRWRTEVAADQATLTEVEEGEVVGHGFIRGDSRYPIGVDITPSRPVSSNGWATCGSGAYRVRKPSAAKRRSFFATRIATRAAIWAANARAAPRSR